MVSWAQPITRSHNLHFCSLHRPLANWEKRMQAERLSESRMEGQRSVAGVAAQTCRLGRSAADGAGEHDESDQGTRLHECRWKGRVALVTSEPIGGAAGCVRMSDPAHRGQGATRPHETPSMQYLHHSFEQPRRSVLICCHPHTGTDCRMSCRFCCGLELAWAVLDRRIQSES